MGIKPSLAARPQTEIAPARLADPAWGWALRLLIGYQALFIGWCAWVSSVFPKWTEEASISIWPITAPLGTWLERVVLMPLVRYDVVWYLGIAQFGYGHKPGDTAFHPLYPLLMAIGGRLLGGSYLLAGWLISLACTFAMLVLLYRLVRLDYDDAVAQRATLYLIGSPLGFAFLIPYTEPLLLLSIVGALYGARRGRWVLAGLAGATATLTKQPGLVVLLPMLVTAWGAWRAATTGGRARILAGLALPALGLLLWLLYRATLGDVSFSLSDPSSLVGALLVTPDYRDVWGEFFSWPWVNFGYALEQLNTRPYFYLIINVFLMLAMLAVALYSTLRVRRWYVALTLPLILMNLSIVYPIWPYMGIVRRFTIIIPIFIQLALVAVRRPLLGALVLVMNALLWTLIASMYVRNAFVP